MITRVEIGIKGNKIIFLTPETKEEAQELANRQGVSFKNAFSDWKNQKHLVVKV